MSNSDYLHDFIILFGLSKKIMTGLKYSDPLQIIIFNTSDLRIFLLRLVMTLYEYNNLLFFPSIYVFFFFIWVPIK